MAASVSQSKTYVQISQQLLNELQSTFIPRERFVKALGTWLAFCLVPSLGHSCMLCFVLISRC